MSVVGHFSALARMARIRAARFVLRQRILARHPTLVCDPTAIWDYGYRDIGAIEIGANVSVGAFAEIVVQARSAHSSVPGRLILADGAVIGSGANIRAAGGTIRLGRESGVSPHTVVIAANHESGGEGARLRTRWNETTTGVDVGENVWVGSHSVLLPGTRIGNGSVVAAGSVVRGAIPPGELWGGVPARKLRDL